MMHGIELGRPPPHDPETALSLIEGPKGGTAGQHDIRYSKFVCAVEGGVHDRSRNPPPSRLRPHYDVVNLPIRECGNQQQAIHGVARSIQRDVTDRCPNGEEFTASPELTVEKVPESATG